MLPSRSDPDLFWMDVLELMERGMLTAFGPFLLQLFLGSDLIQPQARRCEVCGFTSTAWNM